MLSPIRFDVFGRIWAMCWGTVTRLKFSVNHWGKGSGVSTWVKLFLSTWGSVLMDLGVLKVHRTSRNGRFQPSLLSADPMIHCGAGGLGHGNVAAHHHCLWLVEYSSAATGCTSLGVFSCWSPLQVLNDHASRLGRNLPHSSPKTLRACPQSPQPPFIY